MDSKHLPRAGLIVGFGAIAFVTGCAASGYRESIQAPYSNDRILAIREAGERRDRLAIPLLVDRVEDEDSAVRFYAILALERITGDRLGYRYEDSASERQEAVDRWRRYAVNRDEKSVESHPPASQPVS